MAPQWLGYVCRSQRTCWCWRLKVWHRWYGAPSASPSVSPLLPSLSVFARTLCRWQLGTNAGNNIVMWTMFKSISRINMKAEYLPRLRQKFLLNFFNLYCRDSDVDEKMSFPGIFLHFESALPVDRMLVGKAHRQLERFSIWGDIETSSTPLTNILLLLMEQNFWFNTGVFQKSS